MGPSRPGGAARAAVLISSNVSPSTAAVAARLRATLTVQTNGRNPPVASAKPATTPDGSWVCCGLRLKTVRLVPTDTPALVEAQAEGGGHVVPGTRGEGDPTRSGRLAPDATRFWAVSGILGFLPYPAHILVGLRTADPDLAPGVLRRGPEDLLARTLA